jgi:hypothetical protein
MFQLLLARCNESARKPMEAPLDGFITRATYWATCDANNYSEHIREYNSAKVFVLVGAAIK